MSIDDSRRDDLLDRLAEEFADRFRRGERPALKDYTDRYPELADEIRELFPALIKVEQAEEICHDRGDAERAPPLSQVGDYRIIREIGHGGMGVVYEAEQVSLGRRVALELLPWQAAQDRTSAERFRREARASARLHHSNIVPVFEVGQDGEVRYYTMQFIQGQSLDAVIDELRRLRSRSPRERGHRPDRGETQPTASDTRGAVTWPEVAQSLLTGRFELSPMVEPVAGASSPSPGGSARSGSAPPTAPDPSAVMPGGTQLSTAESRHRAFHRGVAHLGRQTASALAHAHARGIVHRDIKPSNLLLDTEGVVWVTDFGLAKVDADDLTRTGDVLGTLRYMAPERFRGQEDARADLYSLGLTLYELLVLRPAFDSPDRMALSEQIKTVEPLRPRSIDPRIPRDLETIVLKAIEKEPGDRYASADAMAEDLRRFLDDEPILARRVGAAERYLRWARRNRVIAVLGVMLTTVLVGATIASVIVAGQMAALATANERAAQSERDAKLTAQAAQKQSEADRRAADHERDRAQGSLYGARITLAENAIRQNDSATAAKLLDLCRPEPGGTDRRGWEWLYLDQWSRPELRTLRIADDPIIYALAVSPDGRFLVAAGGIYHHWGQAHEVEPATVNVYDLPGLTLRRTLAGHWDQSDSVAFRPDGKRLATAATDGRVKLWDPASWRELRTFDGGTRAPRVQPRPARVLCWSPDGRRLAIRSEDSLRILDPETGRTTTRIAESVESMAWSPDGSRIATAMTGAREVRVWHVEDGRLLRPPLEAGDVILSIFWIPPGRWLTGFCTDGTRKTWDLATGQVRRGPVIAPDLERVETSRDGSSLLASGSGGLLRVIDAASGKETATLFHGINSIRTMALSTDGSRLFAGGQGMPGLKVFDPRRNPAGRVVAAQPQLCAMAFDERGESLRTINWMPNADGANLEIYDVFGGVSRPGPRLPVSNRSGFPRGDFAFDADGRRLAAPRNGDDSAVGVWDAITGQELASIRASATVVSLAWGAGDTQLATGVWDNRRERGEVAIWDLANGRAVRTFDAGPRTVRAVALSADGRTVAAGGYDGRPEDPGWAVAWDAATGAPRVTLDRAGSIMAMAFHPDGTRLAAADSYKRTLHLWDLTAGTEVQGPAPFSVSCLAFTPDGTRLASVGYDGQVHLADARTAEELLVLRSAARPPGSAGFTPRLTFSRDGSRLAANGVMDVSIWETRAPTGPDPPPEPADATGWLRQGRALGGQGDPARAEAAYARARDDDDGDPSPWIEHALVLWRLGDAPRARLALDRGIRSLPDDPERWLDLGYLLARFGRTKESETAMGKARALAERRLLRNPEDERAAAVLAETLLLDAGFPADPFAR